MAKERMFDFCTSCRKETSYKICKKNVQKVIKDKSYEFEISIAVCDECGKEMDIPGLLDSNIKSSVVFFSTHINIYDQRTKKTTNYRYFNKSYEWSLNFLILLSLICLIRSLVHPNSSPKSSRFDSTPVNP